MKGCFGTPNPLVFAMGLPIDVRRALKTARMTIEGMAIHPELHPTLKPYSLVDCRKPFLSAFGTRVLNACRKNGI